MVVWSRDVVFVLALNAPPRLVGKLFSICKLFSSVNTDYFWNQKIRRDYNINLGSWRDALSLYKRHYSFKDGKVRVFKLNHPPPTSFDRIYNNFAVYQQDLCKLFQQGLRKGDVIQYNSTHTYGNWNQSIAKYEYYMYDGQSFDIKLLDGFGRINRSIRPIEDYDIYHWVDHLGPVYSIYFDPRPYRDEIISHIKRPLYNVYESLFTDFRGRKYLIKCRTSWGIYDIFCHCKWYVRRPITEDYYAVLESA